MPEVVERKVFKKKATTQRTLIFGGFVYNKQGCYKKQGRKFCKETTKKDRTRKIVRNNHMEIRREEKFYKSLVRHMKLLNKDQKIQSLKLDH